ncbi:uncharacterized protein BDV17DRAFT_46008 [Aspergillus undulatus]|uniref:uncharacterized protein n=1 Tax=Aspergillus undulatus TaxID=1810928 RepID=UPI003CCD354C
MPWGKGQESKQLVLELIGALRAEACLCCAVQASRESPAATKLAAGFVAYSPSRGNKAEYQDGRIQEPSMYREKVWK